MDLSGKTALLTGASKGLGRELAVQLDALGTRLLLVARDVRRLDELQQVLTTPGSRQYPRDLGDPDARARLIEDVFRNESRLDVLIHCAGIGSHSTLDQLTAEEIQQVIQVNAVAPMELTALLSPLFPADKPAAAVFIGSVAGELILPGMSLYSASKAALHAFSQANSLEVKNFDHFSLLIILGALRRTHFAESIRHPRTGQPSWYRRLDVHPTYASKRIIQAIEQQRTRLVIPGWYKSLLWLGNILAPLVKITTRWFYHNVRLNE